MKKMWLILSVVVALGFSACEKEKEDEIIDYSNIDKLYEQPLEVIQKCVQGKWKLLY